MGISLTLIAIRGVDMGLFVYNNKKYKVDSKGFLENPKDWDEDFAIGMAPRLKIPNGLTEKHWKVIYFIRNTFDVMNRCPLVYIACKENKLGLGDFKKLFPTGYLRGVCKLAGVTYRDVFIQKYWLEGNIDQISYNYKNRVYKTDVHGFLLDYDDWDENYAINKAYEMKMPDYLTEKHWKIIYYLREGYKKAKEIPTVYRTCEENNIDLTELEKLFPDGYHRGAVKIAGLRY
ncbi:MAG: TusE/DsrC/DsvC family sulfur relay protein [Candidatus Zixiibacteriota bacterium]|nr:MAG: TusE/DsrC/DsvC family sulfur relay protein [candidate division Zixibacteria bacterium]